MPVYYVKDPWSDVLEGFVKNISPALREIGKMQMEQNIAQSKATAEKFIKIGESGGRGAPGHPDLEYAYRMYPEGYPHYARWYGALPERPATIEERPYFLETPGLLERIWGYFVGKLPRVKRTRPVFPKPELTEEQAKTLREAARGEKMLPAKREELVLKEGLKREGEIEKETRELQKKREEDARKFRGMLKSMGRYDPVTGETITLTDEEIEAYLPRLVGIISPDVLKSEQLAEALGLELLRPPAASELDKVSYTLFKKPYARLTPEQKKEVDKLAKPEKVGAIYTREQAEKLAKTLPSVPGKVWVAKPHEKGGWAPKLVDIEKPDVWSINQQVNNLWDGYKAELAEIRIRFGVTVDPISRMIFFKDPKLKDSYFRSVERLQNIYNERHKKITGGLPMFPELEEKLNIKSGSPLSMILEEINKFTTKSQALNYLKRPDVIDFMRDFDISEEDVLPHIWEKFVTEKRKPNMP